MNSDPNGGTGAGRRSQRAAAKDAVGKIREGVARQEKERRRVANEKKKSRARSRAQSGGRGAKQKRKWIQSAGDGRVLETGEIESRPKFNDVGVPVDLAVTYDHFQTMVMAGELGDILNNVTGGGHSTGQISLPWLRPT